MLLIILAIVFLMGMFIDGAAITVMTMPIFFHAISQTDIDPLLFGTLFTLNIVIGYLTPPFGMNLFYMKGISPPGTKMSDIYASIVPYVTIMAVVMILILLFPQVALWLPNHAVVTK